jgi:hypothetical protein
MATTGTVTSLIMATVTDFCEDEEKWYRTSGIEDEDVVAAYQPKGASSYANSLENLVEDEHDAFDDGGDTVPDWNATDGWIGSGGQQYLRSDISPAPDQSWSMLVRVSAITMLGSKICGSVRTIGGSQTFGVETEMIPNQVYYKNGSSINISPWIEYGVIGFAGNTAYRNGIAEAGTISSGTGTDVWPIDPMGNNVNNYHVGVENVNIQAEVWYNKVLTPTQMAAISSQMAAL